MGKNSGSTKRGRKRANVERQPPAPARNVRARPATEGKERRETEISTNRPTKSTSSRTCSRIITNIASQLEVERPKVDAAVRLLGDGNTVPFIARYRKEATGGLSDSELRRLSDLLDGLERLEKRRENVLFTLSESGQLTTETKTALDRANTLQEIEDLYLPFKPKRNTRAGKAIELGLEPLADILISNSKITSLRSVAMSFVNKKLGVENVNVALQFAKDILAKRCAELLPARSKARELLKRYGRITSKPRSGVNNALKVAKKRKGRPTRGKVGENKYQQYHNFSCSVMNLKAHQTLALNRGVDDGFLSVRIEWGKGNYSFNRLLEVAVRSISKRTDQSSEVRRVVTEACSDGIKRLLMPAIEREMVKTLAEKAAAESISVFARNLRSLLLQPPFHGTVLGLDPGYRTGCKMAICCPMGGIKHTGILYLLGKYASSASKLQRVVKEHNVSAIAIGDGTASRETEEFVAQAKLGSTPWSVVSEAGASVYSASELASSELAELDVSLRGAVSIARRLQDPLAELVKIPPHHIGIGLYQHDLNEKTLSHALDGVVEACVNEVGVNINTASESLLQHVAGLNKSTAAAILSHRELKGPFRCRSELLKIKGIGQKIFRQCAGFLRIHKAENVLDSTSVHPESYKVAQRLIGLLEKDEKIVLSVERLHKLETRLVALLQDEHPPKLSNLATRLGTGQETLKDIIRALTSPGRDVRGKLKLSELRQGVARLDDLRIGEIVHGTVSNVVPFGAFVDIGVGQNGLLHSSQMSKQSSITPGQKLRVEILNVDVPRKRVSLKLHS